MNKILVTWKLNIFIFKKSIRIRFEINKFVCKIIFMFITLRFNIKEKVYYIAQPEQIPPKCKQEKDQFFAPIDQ